MSTDTRLMVDAIRIDGGTQPRVAISETTVAEYAEAMRETPDAFPPVVVFFDGVDYWLADGFHRVHAARRSRLAGITATIHKGTKRDAILYSVGVNQSHGLRRTNDDKRKAVATLLNDTEWRDWPQPQMAKHCGVSREFVSRMHSEMKALGTLTSDRSQVRFTTKHGTETTMNVGNIGRTSKSEPAPTKGMPDRSPKAVQERRDRLRQMAADGYTSIQMAAELGLSLDGCRSILRQSSIDVPADTVTRGSRHIDSNRVVGAMVMTAENLTADVGLIDFSALDHEHLDDWVLSLTKSRNSLNTFIRRLSKELGKDVEAA